MRRLQKLTSYNLQVSKTHLIIEDFYCYQIAINQSMANELKELDINFCSTENYSFLPTEVLQLVEENKKENYKKSLRDFLSGADEITASELALGAQLINWDKSSRYCGYCGSALQLQENDLGKICSHCQKTDYPRIQPVAIVLIQRGEELLLAKGPAPRKFYSCIAGFVEAGENLEDCVKREVLEEVGCKIKNLQYFGSQPWPFPHNLMLAFIADWDSGEIKIDYNELTDAAWFTKDNPPEYLPGHLSIARKMIDSIWL